ncbi:MAG TPA: cation:proton antiporter [Gemmatimonadaceae bacterium]|nr:cation:proton antiporter [Gemmatimonadaceae bacterium]
MSDFGLLQDLVVLFASGALAIVLFQRARVPPLLGYLLTGVVIGPHGLGVIGAASEVQALADVGVILFLFTIGVQLSIDELTALGRTVVVGGGIQILGTIALVAVLAAAVGAPWSWAIFLGMLVSLSSTTLIVRLFSDRGELASLHARVAVGVALFQDISIVPMVLAIPLLTGSGGSPTRIAGTMLVAVTFVAGALLVARKVVPPLLERVVATRQREAFLLVVMVLCLGAAWAAASVGLSLALGAFIAGLVISESEYSYQALSEVLPLREIFISLFFISVGMMLDPRVIAAEPLLTLAALAIVVAAKAVVAIGALLAVGHALRTALLAGVALAELGEFGFVLAAEGTRAGLLDERWMQLFLATAVGSMIAMPLLLAAVPRVAAILERRLPAALRHGSPRYALAEGGLAAGREPVAHVIIAGYGMNGRILAHVLASNGIPFVGVEVNPEVVRAERAHGHRLLYGDATRLEVLRPAGIATARVLVIAISDATATRQMVAVARRANPLLHIVVRTRYVSEIARLDALGTNEVVAEEFETSIEIFSRVLIRYQVPDEQIERSINEVREDAYELLRTGIAVRSRRVKERAGDETP